MGDALYHRGPDEDGYLIEPGIGIAHRRLSIVGLSDGQQPIYNEDRSVVVMYNGELFDYPEKKAELEAKGHHFRTSCDTEVLVHLWEEHGEAMLPMLRGQYAFALYDYNRRVLILARDRIGICPLHYARRGDWFYFGSEIKAILASGRVEAETDPAGIDNIFTFFAMPTKRTMFKDIYSIYPGNYLRVQLRPNGDVADISEKVYWDLNFPDKGQELKTDPEKLVEEFGEKFRRAVEIRLRADVPVVSYLSGGIDSAMVAAVASDVRGDPIPSFTIQIKSPRFDETDSAMLNARTIGCKPTIVSCDDRVLSEAYPKLIQASDSPVVDTACAALYLLAGEVHRQGIKVALTGEGADEALAGYPWFKINRLMQIADINAFRPSQLVRKIVLSLAGRNSVTSDFPKFQELMGGSVAQADLYSLIRVSREMFYSGDLLSKNKDYLPFADLKINRDAMQKWDPLNKSLYMGYKTILAGLLMNHKGDRVAMANSVETRYPFLDEDFVEFCTKIDPKWKLRGIIKDKYILRQLALGRLPREIAQRPKAMFRAPFADTFLVRPPAYVDQLLSEESLKATGYFDPKQVLHYRSQYANLGWQPVKKLVAEMGLTAVMATQLWHHTYMGGGLCELPTWSIPTSTPAPAQQILA